MKKYYYCEKKEDWSRVFFFNNLKEAFDFGDKEWSHLDKYDRDSFLNDINGKVYIASVDKEDIIKDYINTEKEWREVWSMF